MKRIFFLLAVLFSCKAFAQTPTWSDDIAQIVYDHCTTCHRPGEIAAVSFMTYATADSDAINIEQRTSAHIMPPWPADPNYRHYADENVLSQNEIDKIAQWVDGGAPEGNPNNAPPPPIYPTGSQIGTPDAVVSMSQSYVQPADNLDHYMTFVLPSGFLENKNVSAIEFRPGNKSIVHHVFIFEDTTGTVAANDALTPEYGIEGITGTGAASCIFLTLWRPGMKVRKFPEGMGYNLKTNADIIIQIHYAPTTIAQSDSSSVNIFYSTATAIREVLPKKVGEQYIVEPDFTILANQIMTFHSEVSFNFGDMSLIAISPHMHLLGQSFKVFSVTSTFDTIPLVNVPKWYFNWQFLYTFQWLQKIEAGSTYYAQASYDNTVNNPDNPNNPPIDVGYGSSTSDEMFRFFLIQVPYQAGDENILLDSSLLVTTAPVEGIVSTPQLYNCAPNPASSVMTLSFYLPNESECSFYIVDVLGRLKMMPVQNSDFNSGFHRIQIDVSDLAKGNYILRMKSGQIFLNKVFVLQ